MAAVPENSAPPSITSSKNPVMSNPTDLEPSVKAKPASRWSISNKTKSLPSENYEIFPEGRDFLFAYKAENHPLNFDRFSGFLLNQANHLCGGCSFSTFDIT